MSRPRKSTLIRNERKATAARKRAALEFQTPNKKPLACAKGYDFRVAGTPTKAPATDYPHSPIRSMNDEICR